MPVITTIKVTVVCKTTLSEKTYIEATPWAGNLFRLIYVKYWDDMGGSHLEPKQITVRHDDISPQDLDVILKALVDEWNLYHSALKKDLGKCTLSLDPFKEDIHSQSSR